MTEWQPAAPVVGFLDSGVGGLSVLRHVRDLLPAAALLYFADQAHIPYGPRPAAEIQQFTAEISRFLLARGAAVIVLACNTATAAAVEHLRAAFPGVPFVGMEPAVKPGAALTRQGKIGILATTGTFGSRRYQQLLARFGRGVMALEDPCLGLVEEIEAGRLDGRAARAIVGRAIRPMLAAGVDTLVLGCTHYPFVQSIIQEVAGPAVTVVDPAPAVARQVQRVLAAHLTAPIPDSEPPDPVQAYTTGDPDHFAALAARLLGYAVPAAAVRWTAAGRLEELPEPGR